MGSNSSQETIGKRIAELRQKNNLTQSELASKLCVSREMINYWEKGSRDIKTGNIVLLSEVLNTTCDYLLQGIKPNSIDIFRDLGLSQAAIDKIREIKGDDDQIGDISLVDTLSQIIANDNFHRILSNICCAKEDRDLLLPFHGYLVEKAKKIATGTYQKSTYDRAIDAICITGLAPLYKAELFEAVCGLFDEVVGYENT